MPHCN